ncbi:hypothetical protein [Marinactinospora rubrisoli]|uniref:Antitoxin n=1 Tax=Marinactinospora rubrisoli TaxID=2715399 RepID=A0ABW2KQ84_9ACTN
MPAPQHHPELTEEDRAYIAEHAARVERGEPIEGYSIEPADWDTYEEFLDCANDVMKRYLADRAAAR